MTEYEALQNKKVKVTRIKNLSYNKNGNLYVDKVILQVQDKEIPKGKITINAKVSETELEIQKEDGVKVPNEIEEDRDPTVKELFSEFPRIKKLFSAIEDYGEIEITGLIRAVRDSKGDDWNFFIRASELDKIEASTLSDSENETESMAEDFVKDQTSIETDGSDREDSKESEKEDCVIFGEEE